MPNVKPASRQAGVRSEIYLSPLFPSEWHSAGRALTFYDNIQT